MDGDTAIRAARHAPITWRRLIFAVLLGLSALLSQGRPTEHGTPGDVQASPLAAEADLRVSLDGSDWRADPNGGFAYHVTVTNHGNAAAPAHIETVLHPALSNVTVTASGFSCNRQFEAGGTEPGTAIRCTSWEPLAPSEMASFTVRVRAAGAPGTYGVVTRVGEDVDGNEDSGVAAELHVGS